MSRPNIKQLQDKIDDLYDQIGENIGNMTITEFDKIQNEIRNLSIQIKIKSLETKAKSL